MVGDEKKACVRMNPISSDERVKGIGDGVVGLKVKCVVARDKGYGGEREEGDGGRGVVWLVRWAGWLLVHSMQQSIIFEACQEIYC